MEPVGLCQPDGQHHKVKKIQDLNLVFGIWYLVFKKNP
jgi:hypothetical protein